MAAIDDPDPDYRSLSRPPPPTDPDIQATLSDFLTYTEHFPSHLTRAMSLIHEQRIKAERMVKQIHDDTTAYSVLPTLTTDRPDPVKLRRDISRALEEAEAASRMSLAEAARLDEEAKREARRLDIVTEKLKAQPKPPSRDPTPEQQALTSPNLKRERGVGSRGDDNRPEKQLKRVHDKAASKIRGRKIMVPGEVIPPPDPNAPLDNMSDWTSARNSPALLEIPGGADRQRSRTPKVQKQQSVPGAYDDKNAKPRVPRAPGHQGTNAHSAVAGISTSNALLALHEPPPDAANGSKWLPWMKLTEWEMAKLRKRMKKNAIWVPSQTMVRRELKNLGRGMTGKEAARARAEAAGERFVDEPNEADPTKVIISGEETDQMNAMLGPQVYAEDDDADAELINRGMRLNEAKKLKRQRMKEEEAIQQQIAREQGVDLPADGTKLATASPEHKKRKREATPAAGPSTHETDNHKPGPILKKLKASAPSQPASQKVPLAAPGVSSSPKVATTRHSRRAATPPVTKRPTITLKVGKAVSEEPPGRRASLRRNSNASLPSTSMSSTNAPASPDASTAVTKSGRRSRRPVPGVITSKDDESAKVGVSRRKAAPNRKRSGGGKKDSLTPNDPHTAPEAPEEDIDPNEPRYCICGDVSWGTMVGCDADDCKQEWFHLECVNLTEEPKRLTKWYCPDCRKKLKLGVNTNGLVGRNV